MFVAEAIGQHDGGVKLVNWFHAGLCSEQRFVIAKDFASPTSGTRVLFSTSALGMGQDMSDLHMVWGIDPPADVEEWMQMLGRGGRDGKQSTSKLFFDSSNLGGKVSSEMRAFCCGNRCLRVLLARHFNPFRSRSAGVSGHLY